MKDTFRKDAKRTILVHLFCDEIEKSNYSLIAKLYEVSGIQRRDIINQRNERRCFNGDLTKLVFNDIRDVLIDRILSDDFVEQEFIEICSKRWPDVVRIYNDVVEDANRYHKLCKRFDRERRCFVDYLLINNEALDEDDYRNKMSLKFDVIESVSTTHLNSFGTTLYKDYKKVMFFDETQEFILESPVYDKFLKNRYEALAHHMNARVSDVPSAIRNSLNYIKDYAEKKGFLFDFSSCSFQAANLIDNHFGNMLWIDRIISSKNSNVGGAGKGFGYFVDVDRIIKEFYKTKVIAAFFEKYDNDEPFRKSALLGGWNVPVEVELQEIKYMCVIDVLYRLYEIEVELYYDSFSWESFTGKQLEDRYAAIIEELKNVITSKDKSLVALEEEIKELKQKGFKDVDATLIIQNRKKEELQKNIEVKDKEINVLKNQLRLYEEFDGIKSQNEEDILEEIDPEFLKTKRYLFVGHESDIINKLRREFPNSVFITENTSDISSIKVDGIVMLISRMSHALYYKVKMSPIYREVDTAMCNSDNINNVILDMSKVFSDYTD